MFEFEWFQNKSQIINSKIQKGYQDLLIIADNILRNSSAS